MTGEKDIRAVVATQSDHAAWSAFVGASPDSEAAHRWEFHDAIAHVFGAQVVRLAAHRDGEWLAVLPLVSQRSFVGKFLTSVPYLNHAGVLGATPAARGVLADEACVLAARLGTDRLELRGRDGSDLPIATWDGKAGYSLALPREAPRLWDALGAKVRSQVKRPAREGYGARIAASEGRAPFYSLFARRWHELGSPVLPEAFFSALESVFGSDLEYVLVEKGSEVVAAAVLLRHRARVEIPWASSSSEHDRYGVNMMLYWKALERAIESGATTFDFGRSTPGTGNARFKLQWGATESALRWNVWVRDARGRAGERGDGRRGLAAAAWRRLPRFLASRLGPALAARIPY